MNDLIIKRKPIVFEHDVILYVPVFQRDFEDDGTLSFNPYFIYSYENASQDLQFVASLSPDYILELKGTFKAETKPIIFQDDV